MTIYTWLIVICWLVFLITWFVFAFSAKKRKSGFSRGIFWRTLALLIVIFFVHTSLLNGPKFFSEGGFSNESLSLLGVILTALGIGFAIWARVYLGKNWGMPMSEVLSPELVTDGPYTYVRHPIYTGIIFAMIGSALASNISWLVLVIVFGAYFVYAALTEEKRMEQEFRETYRTYKSHTKMLIPFIF